MKYMGSKARYAKEILPIILKNRKEDQYYIEPFCGGCNLLDKVKNPRIANDINPWLILFFKSCQEGFIPPQTVTEDEYNYYKINKPFKPITAFIGFGCSFGGKWFGGYARGEGRNYANESYRNFKKQNPLLKGVSFYNEDYYKLIIPENSIIYCDPPYANTTKYQIGDFNHGDFWRWCNEQINKGHKVFVSEYNAPEGWTCVWEKEVSSSLTKDTGSKKAIERLFTK